MAYSCEHKRCKRKEVVILVCKDCGACFEKKTGDVSATIKRIATEFKKQKTIGKNISMDEEMEGLE